PDLLLNLSYKAATGSTSATERQVSTFPFAVGTGNGFNTIGIGATALKRQDPLVFLGAVNYFHPFSAKIAGADQTIGDIFELRLAAILAASPYTSLRIA